MKIKIVKQKQIANYRKLLQIFVNLRKTIANPCKSLQSFVKPFQFFKHKKAQIIKI